MHCMVGPNDDEDPCCVLTMQGVSHISFFPRFSQNVGVLSARTAVGTVMMSPATALQRNMWRNSFRLRKKSWHKGHPCYDCCTALLFHKLMGWHACGCA